MHVLNREALKTQHSFQFSPSSGHVLPLQTLWQRIYSTWETLTWPVMLKVIKADIAVTLALSLIMIDAIREKTSLGGILACVAVEFVHPAQSYGLIVEDATVGAMMCIVSAAWSLLGTYCASLVRNPESNVDAQSAVCAVLYIFLIFGAFVLNYIRVKAEQANVGGTLSASIMVLSLTGAVKDHQWNPVAVIQFLVPTLIGFAIVFVVCVAVWPENSTKGYVQHLIGVLETFDGITNRQVRGFLSTLRPGIHFPQKELPETLAAIHTTADKLLLTLAEKKRTVRREVSFNRIAPVDVSEMTRVVKAMRVPLQGIGLSRTMEDNMRKAEARYRAEVQMRRLAANDTLDPLSPVGRHSSVVRGHMDDDDDDPDAIAEDRTVDDHASCTDAKSPTMGSDEESCKEDMGLGQEEVDDDVQTRATYSGIEKRPKDLVFLSETLLTTADWRERYATVLDMVRPLFMELNTACSLATQASIMRLRYLQQLQSMNEDRSFFAKWFCRCTPTRYEGDRTIDPSVPLLRAIQRFDTHRLTGLTQLFSEKRQPRRILFLLLLFQLNLRAYAEKTYTLTSLIYEMDRTRTGRRVWWPHISLRKFLWKKPTEESLELDTPGAIAQQSNSLSLQRTLTQQRATALNDLDMEAQMTGDYPLAAPTRGYIGHKHQPRHDKKTEEKSSGELNPDTYHDPDAAYPTTRTERFFYRSWLVCVNHLYTSDTAFALRAVLLVTALSLPGFLEQSHDWYLRARGQWAVIVALIWMGPSVGSNFFGTMVRTIGTFIGAVMALLIWEISRGSVPGLLILTFVFNLPWWLLYINGQFWRSTGLFALITISLIIGYAYTYKVTEAGISIYEVTYERTVAVLAGVVGALVLSVFPYPRTGRVVLRHRVAATLGQMGALYASFLSLLMKNRRQDKALRDANRKMFRSVAATIRRQIAGERVLLEQSRFEPALRGKFPEAQYLQILQVLDNMLNRMLEMEAALEKISARWRMIMVKDTWKERKEMIASFLTALHLAANALVNKTPLPPYVLRPTKARRNLTVKVRSLSLLQPERLGDPEYTYYSAYLMNSEQLAVEIELLVATVRELVGPDSVSLWLEYRH